MTDKKKAKLKVLKVQKVKDGAHRLLVELDTDVPLPADPLPKEPIEVATEPSKSTWATFFKSLWSSEDHTSPHTPTENKKY